MTKKQKKMIVRLGISAVFLAAGMIWEGSHPADWVLFLISYLSAGYDIPLKALPWRLCCSTRWESCLTTMQ